MVIVCEYALYLSKEQGSLPKNPRQVNLTNYFNLQNSRYGPESSGKSDCSKWKLAGWRTRVSDFFSSSMFSSGLWFSLRPPCVSIKNGLLTPFPTTTTPSFCFQMQVYLIYCRQLQTLTRTACKFLLLIFFFSWFFFLFCFFLFSQPIYLFVKKVIKKKQRRSKKKKVSRFLWS